MVYPAKHFITPEEYLTLEEMAETKHEYFNGQFYDLKQVVRLRRAGCELPLRKIYRKVELPA